MSAETATAGAFTPLMDLAGPELYRRNLFRVLDLSTDAGQAEARRMQRRRLMQARLSAEAAPAHGGPRPLDPPPGEEETRSALERMGRPIDRLVDETLWFWPDPHFPAPLTAETYRDAREAWRRRDDAVARHNLAVADHLDALESLAAEDAAVTAKSARKRMARALGRWREAAAMEATWDHLRGRIKTLDDAQLGPAMLRRLRDALPEALLQSGARLALRLAENGRTELAAGVSLGLRTGGFGAERAEAALRLAVEPLRRRIAGLVESAEAAWTADARAGAEAIRRLGRDARPLLSVAEHVLPKDDVVRLGMADAVARAMLRGQIAYGTKTEDWAGSEELLVLARSLGPSDGVKDLLHDNIDQIRENAENANPWVSPGYWDLPEATLTELESLREKGDAGAWDGVVERLAALWSEDRDGPVRRCFVNALSRSSIGEVNAAQNELVNDLTVIERILANLRADPDRDWFFPDPHGYVMPPCPGCNRVGYDRWREFTFGEQKLFMCAACADEDDANQARAKVALRKRVVKASAAFALAEEIDPKAPSILRNGKVLREILSELGAQMAGTRALKRRLGLLEPVRWPLRALIWGGTGTAVGLAIHAASFLVPSAGEFAFSDSLEWRAVAPLITAAPDGPNAALSAWALEIFLVLGWGTVGAALIGSLGLILGLLALGLRTLVAPGRAAQKALARKAAGKTAAPPAEAAAGNAATPAAQSEAAPDAPATSEPPEPTLPSTASEVEPAAATGRRRGYLGEAVLLTLATFVLLQVFAAPVAVMRGEGGLAGADLGWLASVATPWLAAGAAAYGFTFTFVNRWLVRPATFGKSQGSAQ